MISLLTLLHSPRAIRVGIKEDASTKAHCTMGHSSKPTTVDIHFSLCSCIFISLPFSLYMYLPVCPSGSLLPSIGYPLSTSLSLSRYLPLSLSRSVSLLVAQQ